MPEGPSIVILKEQAGPFSGRFIHGVEGNAKLDLARLDGARILALRSFGKQFLIQTSALTVRIHLLMFGSYRIDERARQAAPRLALRFRRRRAQLLRLFGAPASRAAGQLYDWRADVMSDAWDPRLARKRLRAKPRHAGLRRTARPDVFAGVGNIIKNEVLFRIRVHPLSTVGALPAAKLRELVREGRASTVSISCTGRGVRVARALAGTQQERVPTRSRQLSARLSRHAAAA